MTIEDHRVAIRIERFWSYVDQSGGPEACWPWTRSTYPEGYGQATRVINGKTATQAHKQAWVLTNGDPGTYIHPRTGRTIKYRVMHRCPGGPNRLCCNPGHLATGSDKDNADDRAEDGNTFRGTMVTIAKLDDEKVREARRLRVEEGWPWSKLAAHFGVAIMTIKPAVRGDTWKHVT